MSVHQSRESGAFYGPRSNAWIRSPGHNLAAQATPQIGWWRDCSTALLPGMEQKTRFQNANRSTFRGESPDDPVIGFRSMSTDADVIVIGAGLAACPVGLPSQRSASGSSWSTGIWCPAAT